MVGAGNGRSVSMITVRSFHEKDLDDVLQLIGNSDSTDRTKETWLGNHMTAVLAFDDHRLIGIIPFESRTIVLGLGYEIPVLWVSAAHVDPKYRRQGIGSKLDYGIREYFYPEYKAVFVVREDETSAAYRWYKKLNYHHLTNIISLKKDVESAANVTADYVLLETSQAFKEWGPRLRDCFQRNIGRSGGFPVRDNEFWARKFNFHYYRESYRYKLLAKIQKDIVQGYALLGQTHLRDDIDRFDILEWLVPQDKETRNDLYHLMMDYASRINLKELRIQCAEKDPMLNWVKGLGFTQRWQTSLLGKYIDSDKKFSNVDWRFFHIDYI